MHCAGLAIRANCSPMQRRDGAAAGPRQLHIFFECSLSAALPEAAKDKVSQQRERERRVACSEDAIAHKVHAELCFERLL